MLPGEDLDVAIARIVAAAPPLTSDQISKLRRIFRPELVADEMPRSAPAPVKRERRTPTPREFRTHTDEGWQVVVIDDTLAYAWDGPEPLKGGEQVELPGNVRTDWEPYTGIVTGFGSTYPADLLAKVTKRVEDER